MAAIDFEAYIFIQQLMLMSLIFLLSVSVMYFWTNWQPESHLADHDLSKVLLQIITPTSSRWPSRYLLLLERNHKLSAYCSHSRSVSLSVAPLLQDLRAGRVEFRDPRRDLPALLSPGTCTGTGTGTVLHSLTPMWYINLQLDLSLPFRAELLKFLLRARLPQIPCAGTVYYLETAIIRLQRVPPVNKSAESLSIPQEPALVTALYLDLVPPAYIEASIHAFQLSILPNTRGCVRFTTLKRDVDFFSSRFALCAVPFLPRQYKSDRISSNTVNNTNKLKDASHYEREHAANTYDRAQIPTTPLTATPLLTSLHRVLELLSTSPFPGPVVEHVRDVSDARVSALYERADAAALMCGEGVREEAVLAAWEAALLQVGSLVRWEVVVKRC